MTNVLISRLRGDGWWGCRIIAAAGVDWEGGDNASCSLIVGGIGIIGVSIVSGGVIIQ